MENKFYLNEFQYYDGEALITFNIIEVNEMKNTICLAISNRGRIIVTEYDLHADDRGLYFEYGCDEIKIRVDDFEAAEDIRKEVN